MCVCVLNAQLYVYTVGMSGDRNSGVRSTQLMGVPMDASREEKGPRLYDGEEHGFDS